MAVAEYSDISLLHSSDTAFSPLNAGYQYITEGKLQNTFCWLYLYLNVEVYPILASAPDVPLTHSECHPSVH